MQRTLIALALVAAGYALASFRAPARADDSGKLVELLGSIERSQRTIADATKSIARASEKCTK
jgi:hypothetical protein